ncbi:MAG: hypothetical protein HC767_07855 [Akkermansiaceae bacterium]|nr:hypothetical protein [Akkermansiaceae bacterium]
MKFLTSLLPLAFLASCAGSDRAGVSSCDGHNPSSLPPMISASGPGWAIQYKSSAGCSMFQTAKSASGAGSPLSFTGASPSHNENLGTAPGRGGKEQLRADGFVAAHEAEMVAIAMRGNRQRRAERGEQPQLLRRTRHRLD